MHRGRMRIFSYKDYVDLEAALKDVQAAEQLEFEWNLSRTYEQAEPYMFDPGGERVWYHLQIFADELTEVCDAGSTINPNE